MGSRDLVVMGNHVNGGGLGYERNIAVFWILMNDLCIYVSSLGPRFSEIIDIACYIQNCMWKLESSLGENEM